MVDMAVLYRAIGLFEHCYRFIFYICWHMHCMHSFSMEYAHIHMHQQKA